MWFTYGKMIGIGLRYFPLHYHQCCDAFFPLEKNRSLHKFGASILFIIAEDGMGTDRKCCSTTKWNLNEIQIYSTQTVRIVKHRAFAIHTLFCYEYYK